MTTIVITSGTRWTVPLDCQSATIEAIGAGNFSSSAPTNNGGSYAKSVGVALTPGSSVFINIPSGSNGGTTWLNTASAAAPTSATTGVKAAGGQITPVNQSANSIYTAGTGNFYQGGNAGDGVISCCFSSLGGSGGGAGPNGKGGNGGDFGGGAGGANGGGDGSDSVFPNGGSGGASRLGDAGGAGGTVGSPNGGDGVNGSGGGGGFNPVGNGGNGSLDIIWTDFTGATYGVGSGGGGSNTGTFVGSSGNAGGPGGGGRGTLGQGIIVITYTPVSLADGTYTQALTSSGPVYIPPGTTAITAEAIGPGSNGGTTAGQAGGGGGAYAKSTATTGFTVNTYAFASVPAATAYGATAADSWLNYSTNAAPTTNAQGALAKGAASNTGGSSASSLGSVVVYSGGNGGTSQTTTRQKGGGGGSAAGPTGAGLNGGPGFASTAVGGGGGGGGASGAPATAGVIGISSNGGAGGVSFDNTPGGGGGSAVGAKDGFNGSGGGGGGPSTVLSVGKGAAGSILPVYVFNSTVYGPGSGGGGGGAAASNANNTGGAGGIYGGGGGAGGGLTSGGGAGGAGGQGLVVVTFTIGTPPPKTTTTIVIKSGTTFRVPADCQTATIEAIGAGSFQSFVCNSDVYTNGGAYAKSVGVALTPGSLAFINIPAGGGAGEATWFNTASAVAPTSATTGVKAAGGNGAFTSSQEANSIFTAGAGNFYQGGQGAIGFSCGDVYVGGGGGAAGPNGAGGSGGSSSSAGGGGGGANGGGNGSAGSSPTGGSGGASRLGNPGGVGGNASGNTPRDTLVPITTYGISRASYPAGPPVLSKDI